MRLHVHTGMGRTKICRRPSLPRRKAALAGIRKRQQHEKEARQTQELVDALYDSEVAAQAAIEEYNKSVLLDRVEAAPQTGIPPPARLGALQGMSIATPDCAAYAALSQAPLQEASTATPIVADSASTPPAPASPARLGALAETSAAASLASRDLTEFRIQCDRCEQWLRPVTLMPRHYETYNCRTVWEAKKNGTLNSMFHCPRCHKYVKNNYARHLRSTICTEIEAFLRRRAAAMQSAVNVADGPLVADAQVTDGPLVADAQLASTAEPEETTPATQTNRLLASGLAHAALALLKKEILGTLDSFMSLRLGEAEAESLRSDIKMVMNIWALDLDQYVLGGDDEDVSRSVGCDLAKTLFQVLDRHGRGSPPLPHGR
jgi:hypothetical protein